MSRKRSWTDEDLTKAVRESFSWAGVIAQLGLRAGGGTYEHLKSVTKRLGIPTEHFTGQGWNVGVRRKPTPNKLAKPLSELLVKGSRVSSHALKNKLWKAGLKPRRCEKCDLTEWLGNAISLQLHHRDGVKDNNELPNLQILCPNCHSQTPNFCSKVRRCGETQTR